MKPIIVIPTYNEAENIPELIEKIFQLPIKNLELIIVDDGSSDETQEIIRKKQKIYPICLITRSKKLGLGSAYLIGFKKALSLGADYIIEMDADLSHNPKDIPYLLRTIKKADLVVGSRKIRDGKIINWDWYRYVISFSASFILRRWLKLKTRDITAGFRVYSKTALKKIIQGSIITSGFAFQVETLFILEKAGFKIIEIPVTFINRKLGRSKLGIKDIFEYASLVLKIKLANNR